MDIKWHTGETGVLYHVTTSSSVTSISENGISPKYSQGKLKVAWYVNRQNINWSLIHVSAHKLAHIGDLYVCAVMAYWPEIKRTARHGFYYTYETYQVESISPAIMFVEMDK
jgi:hypothetical protein